MKSIVTNIFVALALSFVVLIPASLQASITDPGSGGASVAGKLQFGGDATVGPTFLTFLCDIVGLSCPAGSGAFNVGGAVAQTGSFVPYANDTGFIKSLSNTGGQPLNTPFFLSNFVTFNPAGTIMPPDIAFDLTFIFLGNSGQVECAAPVNQSQVPAQRCTPIIPTLVSASNPLGLSAFNLANTPNGSTASFGLAGTVRRISTGAVTPWNGTFTAQFTNDPGTTDGSYQAVLNQLITTGSVTSSYSATFAATTIPEPQTTALVLGGLLVLLGRVGMRRYNRGRLS